jgi:hypothetical protein
MTAQLDPLTKLGNYLRQHEHGIDVSWTAKVIEEARERAEARAKELREALRKLLDSLICRCDKTLIPLTNINGTCARCNRKTYQTALESEAEKLLAGEPETKEV